MRVDEVLDIDSYFRDPRFKQNKPKPQGTIEEQVLPIVRKRIFLNRRHACPAKQVADMNNILLVSWVSPSHFGGGCYCAQRSNLLKSHEL
jgi:hypothetical protein